MNKNNELTIQDVQVLLQNLSSNDQEEIQISTATDIFNNTKNYKCQAVYSYALSNTDIFNFDEIKKNKSYLIIICAYLKLYKLFANNYKNCEVLTEKEYVELYELLLKYPFMEKKDIYICLAKLFKKIFKKNYNYINPILNSNYIVTKIWNLACNSNKNSSKVQVTYLGLIKLIITIKKYQETFGNIETIEILCSSIVKNLALKIEEVANIGKIDDKDEDDYNDSNSNKENKPLSDSRSMNEMDSKSNVKINKSNTIEKKENEKYKKNKKVTLKESKSKIKDNNIKKENRSSFKLNLKSNSKTLLSDLSSADTLKSNSITNNDVEMTFLDYNNCNDQIIELRLDILQNLCCLNDTSRHNAISQNIIPIINVIIKNCFYPLNRKCFFILSNLSHCQDVNNAETILGYILSILYLTFRYVTNEYLYLPISFMLRNITFSYGSIKSKFYSMHGIDYMFDGIKSCIDNISNFDSIPKNDFSFFYAVDNYVCILKNICLSSKAYTIKEVFLKYSKLLVDILSLTVNYYYEYLDNITITLPVKYKDYKLNSKDSTIIIESNKLYIYSHDGTDYFQYTQEDYDINVKDKYVEKSNDPFSMIIDNILNLFILITNFENTSKLFYENDSLNEILNILKKFINKSKKEYSIIEKLLRCIENMALYSDSAQKIFESLGNNLMDYIFQQVTVESKLISLNIIYNIIITDLSISLFIFNLKNGLIEEIITNIVSTNNDYRDIAIKIINFYVSQNNQEYNIKLYENGCMEGLVVVINNSEKKLVNTSILNMAMSSYLKLNELCQSKPEFCLRMQNEWKQRDMHFKNSKALEKLSEYETNNKQVPKQKKKTKKSLKKSVKKIINSKKIEKIEKKKSVSV
ncbi:ARM repeat-containing protein [Neocallimastix californiae]|uniref:ARM repeat-containing protein n=1 Tax=Neocallimastix californiae TaxID=1754190 RepID=A0A1Y2EQU6_9FUNG|nr:ARM repeat-containing protein [Neocallimastix californiae]|eukprot:ORY73546.1 ARM repeat-containing protein [Neocallimastix californiae]